MAVLQMQRVSICGLKRDRKAILETIQSLGVMEMDQIRQDDGGFEKMDTTNARQSFEKKVHLFEQALHILETYTPEKKSFLSGFEGKTLLGKERLEQTIRQRKQAVETGSALVGISKEIAELKNEIHGLYNQIESLTPWKSLDIPMNSRGTDKTAVILGTLSGQWTLEMVKESLKEAEPELEEVHLEEVSSDRDGIYLSIICLKKDEQKIEEALRSLGFARPTVKSCKSPGEQIKDWEKKIHGLEETIKKKEKEIEALASAREELQIASDYYRIRAEKYQVLGTLPQSERVFCISGYVAKKQVPLLRERIEKVYSCVLDEEDLKEDEVPPTVLVNNRFSSSMEGVVESYGLPGKGEIDPTTVMSFFYVFFFGLMLSDAAYGAIISICCFVLLKKFPRMEKSMQKSLKLFFYCGLSTLVWGVLFGGYFGDVITVAAKTFLGKTVEVKALWFVPLNNPMKMLVYSMLFGTIHLFVGLGIKGYICLKEKRILDFFCDVVLWYAFVIGLILLLIPSQVFVAISQMEVTFPPAVNLLAKGLAIGGAAGLFLMSGRESKNPALRLALGAYDLYNITGWLSDVLSYSRLLALGLATGVIASVVNQMGIMAGKSVVGVIIFIIVFLVGHSLNMAINILGAYVHTNRLQFVEFFGKFYEGSGRGFHPFTQQTKYVEIKEEK